jgi:hypothetical protein
MSDWSSTNGIAVPTATPSGDAGLVLKNDLNVLAARSGAVLAPCRAVATANVSSLSGLQTIDGVSLAAGDRVLLAGQSSASQNGIWVVGSGAWTRSLDYASGTVFNSGGILVLVVEGTDNAKTACVIGSTFSQLTVDSSSPVVSKYLANVVTNPATADLDMGGHAIFGDLAKIVHRSGDYTLTPTDRGILQLLFGNTLIQTFTLPDYTLTTVGDEYWVGTLPGNGNVITLSAGSDFIFDGVGFGSSIVGYGNAAISGSMVVKVLCVFRQGTSCVWQVVENNGFAFSSSGPDLVANTIITKGYLSTDNGAITTDGSGNLTAVSFRGDGSALTGIGGGGGVANPMTGTLDAGSHMIDNLGGLETNSSATAYLNGHIGSNGGSGPATGNGTNCTVSLEAGSTDVAGVITITATTVAGAQTVGTLTWHSGFDGAPAIVLTPVNQAAVANSAVGVYVDDASNAYNIATLKCAGAITGLTLKYAYHVIGINNGG